MSAACCRGADREVLSSAHAVALQDTLSRFGDGHLAAFGDAGQFVTAFDTSEAFRDVELGRFKDWPAHRAEIEGFFRSGRDLNATWEATPRVDILSRDAAVVSGIARYRFRLPNGRRFDNRVATTWVLRRTAAGWRIVHDHGSPAAAGPASPTLRDSANANAWPQWSPDGRSIVFASTRDGDWEIYVMAADGTAGPLGGS
jgi:hypothetical protein